MEIEGHPTQDLVDELVRRGALRAEGTSAGPRVDSLRFIAERMGDEPGFWLFLPTQTYQTGLDELPPE